MYKVMLPNVTRIIGLHIIKPLEVLNKRRTQMTYRSNGKEYNCSGLLYCAYL